jgi:hypothetical protein
MSSLGKFLAVFNIVAAAALAVVVAIDYAKRQAWEYANFVHDVAVNGLPIDQSDSDQQENTSFRDLASGTQQDWFGATGGPVSTQVEEVNRVEGQADALVGAASGDPARAAVLARLLTPFATTLGDRQDYLAVQYYNANPDGIAALNARLEAALPKGVERYQEQAKQLAFGQALAEAAQALGGQPSTPFEQAFVRHLPADPTKADFDASLKNAVQAMGGRTAPPKEQPDQRDVYFKDLATAFLRDLRGGDQQKDLKTLVAEVSAEAQKDLADQYKKRYDELFTAAAAGKSGAKTLSRDERRRAIARLLFNVVGGMDPAALDKDPSDVPAYGRVLAVVGLDAGVEAINAEARTLSEMTTAFDGMTQRERGAFADADRALIDQLKDRADHLAEATDEWRRAEAEHKAQDDLVARRKADVETARDELRKQRELTAAEFAKLKAMSQSLYDIRVKVREADAENQQLEKQIRDLEKGR